MPKRRGRPKIEIYIKQRIFAEALKNRDTPRELLAKQLEVYFLENEVKNVPTIQTMVKLISQVRNEKRKPIDKPWHLTTLDESPEYHISPETVAKIFQLRLKGLKTLSIRDARWFDRLSSLPLPIGVVRVLAQQLSEQEIISVLLNETFDSADFEQYNILGALQDPKQLEQLNEIAELFPEGFDSADVASGLVEQLNTLKTKYTTKYIEQGE